MEFRNNVFYPVWADNSNSTGDNPNGTLHSMDIYTAKVTFSATAANAVVFLPDPRGLLSPGPSPVVPAAAAGLWAGLRDNGELRAAVGEPTDAFFARHAAPRVVAPHRVAPPVRPTPWWEEADLGSFA
jgi:hypothetical protein